MPTADSVIVLGLGAMGSAAACHLARRGARVIGLDRFSPPHEFGSSHGRTRIIREAYFEHPSYVPLLQRAYQLWRELESASGESLLLQTGGIMIGPPESAIVTGSLRSAREHGLPHEALTAAEIARRFPAFRPEPGMVGVLEPRAGVLQPERCLAAHLNLARHHGAEVRTNETALHWEATPDGVTITTDRATHRARQLLITAGAWVTTLCPGLTEPFPARIERQVLHWFQPAPGTPATHFLPTQCPVHLWQCDGHHYYYGFPDTGDGIKVARHHDGEITTAETVRREIGADEVADMRQWLARFLPEANGAHLESKVCVYTNTPDEHFWIDRHPHCPQVLIASPCSGHGFKFASVMGEVLADLILRGESPFDLRLFRSSPNRWPAAG